MRADRIYACPCRGPKVERLVGFDNSHPVHRGSGPGAKRPTGQDHKHRLKSVRPYDYKDAASLLADFWTKERGVSL